MNPAKQKLVEDLASQAGLVLRNVRLIAELRASRQRLVAAQDEERRKIERNIHDGAQQQLVALAVQLKLARTMLDRDVPKGRRADGRPADEGERGLGGPQGSRTRYLPSVARGQGAADALAAQARRSAIPVEVQSDGVGRYPQDVESAVYFCTLEALNNVAKYAEATSATVRLRLDDGRLTFTVTDDGIGFDPATTGYGTGLQGMADRIDAVGGTLEVRSTPGEGTQIIGSLRATVESS